LDFSKIIKSITMLQNLNAFVQRTGIGAPIDYKERMYKKVEQRETKVGECQAEEFGKKTKGSY
jgi:hypothetical protein